MKYLKQFLIILGISLIGEILHFLLPLPIPASIYGMVLLFVLLMTGLLKVDSVKETGKFLIEIMPVMFIPAGVGLLESWDVLRNVLFPVCVVTVVTLVTVMAATGRVSQWIIRRDGAACAAVAGDAGSVSGRGVPGAISGAGDAGREAGTPGGICGAGTAEEVRNE